MLTGSAEDKLSPPFQEEAQPDSSQAFKESQTSKHSYKVTENRVREAERETGIWDCLQGDVCECQLLPSFPYRRHVLVRVAIVVMKHHDQQQVREERVCAAYTSTLRSQSIMESSEDRN